VPGIISPNPAVEATTIFAVELELGIAVVRVVKPSWWNAPLGKAKLAPPCELARVAKKLSKRLKYRRKE
jgi:hypothetical protein